MSNLSTDVYKDNKFTRHLGPFELEMVKRDIHFFYDEQRNYATFSGQLSFGHTFNLPYWDYLDLRGSINEDERKLIRRGSLLLLLSECLEFFEGLGTYYLIEKENLMSLRNSIRTFEPTDKTEEKVKELILTLTERIETKDNKWEKTWDEFLDRLFVTDVYGFHRNKFKSFDNHWEVLFQKYEEK